MLAVAQVNLAQADIIEEDGTSAETMLPPDWPADRCGRSHLREGGATPGWVGWVMSLLGRWYKKHAEQPLRNNPVNRY